ncbi:hypothetical protein vBEcoMphAPEC6_gp137c [Escherichia phage vB_EcoM_phAPEC6]|nr:hypothetical protein vBEcoMphAPEC6_gp137c [Escherichia phage vB_EcoM_phAPEC6]
MIKKYLDIKLLKFGNVIKTNLLLKDWHNAFLMQRFYFYHMHIQRNKMKKTWKIFTIPAIMLLLALFTPQSHVLSLNIVEIILLVIHCVVCYNYVKGDKE